MQDALNAVRMMPRSRGCGSGWQRVSALRPQLQQPMVSVSQSRRRPKRARSTLPRAPPSPLPSPVVKAQDGLTNEEETAAAAIAALGALPVLPGNQSRHQYARLRGPFMPLTALSSSTADRGERLGSLLLICVCRPSKSYGRAFRPPGVPVRWPCGMPHCRSQLPTMSASARCADGGESGATSEAPAAPDSEDEDYEREAAARGQKRPRPPRGVGGGGRRFGRHARADAVKVTGRRASCSIYWKSSARTDDF